MSNKPKVFKSHDCNIAKTRYTNKRLWEEYYKFTLKYGFINNLSWRFNDFKQAYTHGKITEYIKQYNDENDKI